MLPRLQMQTDKDVVEHRAPGEDAGLLEGAHDAERRDAARLQAVEPRAAIDDVSRGSGQIAGNRIES